MGAPPGLDVRPTPAKVKSALFSILGPAKDGAPFLDLYAGSGAVGFEALSRGASHVTFVELHAPTAAAIKRTAADLGVEKRTAIVCAPAEKAAQRVTGRFAFVFADPPYALPPPHLTFSTLRLRGAVDAESLLVYEHRDGAPMFESPGFVTTREARYGDTALQFLKVAA
ncbi:MAG: RsmD family RNA methyltransferase [Candidatus Eremiobacteraeota bacterium]|nr:RsmD family RNA methyltransferase [Candidatus Eremiobacteraeota bacterium]